MKRTFLSLSLFSVLMFSVANASDFNVDVSHSGVRFNTTHLSVSSVDGFFSKFDGHADIDTKTNEIKKLHGSIEISSIDTKDTKRDDHLKQDDFFAASKFQKGNFNLTSFKKLDQDKVEIMADVTLKGITKPVKFTGMLKGPIAHPKMQKQIYGLKLEGSVNRKDFKIGEDFSNIMLGDDVNVNINLELVAK